jgi:hypothetical protein
VNKFCAQLRILLNERRLETIWWVRIKPNDKETQLCTCTHSHTQPEAHKTQYCDDHDITTRMHKQGLSFGYCSFILQECIKKRQKIKRKSIRNPSIHLHIFIVRTPIWHISKEGSQSRPLGRPSNRWESNIKMDLKETGLDGVDLIHLLQGRDQWWALVNMVTIFCIL